MCWGLAYAYWAALSANITSGTDPAATSTPETGPVAPPSPKMSPKAEPGKQTLPVSIAPVTKEEKMF